MEARILIQTSNTRLRDSEKTITFTVMIPSLGGIAETEGVSNTGVVLHRVIKSPKCFDSIGHANEKFIPEQRKEYSKLRDELRERGYEVEEYPQ